MTTEQKRSMQRGGLRWVLLVLATLLPLAPERVRAATNPDCHVGLYQLTDKSQVDIAPGGGDGLRWRRFDGSTGLIKPSADGSWSSTYGWTGRPDGMTVRFSGCPEGAITFNGLAGRRVDLLRTETTFDSHGTALAGRLLLPRGRGKLPIVVLVHGSERDAALNFNALQRILPGEGVGAFVYDKRGTGASQGECTQDFEQLAGDAVAALHEARRLAGTRAGRVGFQGGSQAGWVIPLAVNRAHADFAMVCFGLAVSVIDEDQQEVELEMRDKGYSQADIARALQVASAAENVFASGFTDGFREFDALRALYSDAPWYRDLHGNYTYFLLPHSEAELRAMAPQFNWHTPFSYDPMPTLRSNTTPQLWILGAADYEAPSAETAYRIKSLIADGQPLTMALYPGAEHGMTLFEMDAPGKERLSTRYAPRYFEMLRDYARTGHLAGPYGDALITRPRK